MSTEPRQHVEDPEGLAARERKKAIVSAREDVDMYESEIEQELVTGRLDRAMAMELLHGAVRRYLQRVEPLMSNPELPQADHVYKEVLVGRLVVEPPDLDVGESWEVVAEPQPVAREFTGLREVIEFETSEHSWQFQVRRTEGGFMTASGEIEAREASRKVYLDRSMLLRAVRLADEFLENAGIGLELGEEGDPLEV